MTSSHTEPYRLHVLGAPDLRGSDGARVSSVVAQPKRLSLLLYLVLAPEPVSRSTIAALFWPESDEGRARNALSQAVFYLRRSLAKDVVEGVEGDRLWVPAGRVWCDARALFAGDAPDSELVRCAASREVMEGWNAEDSQPLQEWLDGLRRTVRDRGEELLAVQEPARSDTGNGIEGRPSGRRARAGHRADAGSPLTWRVRRSATAGFAGASLAAALLFVFFARSAQTSPTEQTIVVPLPRVTAASGSAAIPARAIHDEVVARLHASTGVRVVSAPFFESVDQLRRQIDVFDSPDEPAWVLGISSASGPHSTTVFAFLYEAPTYEVIDVTRFEVDHDTGSGDLIATAPTFARLVGDMVDDLRAEARGR